MPRTQRITLTSELTNGEISSNQFDVSDGMSAFELDVLRGYEGTIDDWLTKSQGIDLPNFRNNIISRTTTMSSDTTSTLLDGNVLVCEGYKNLATLLYSDLDLTEYTIVSVSIYDTFLPIDADRNVIRHNYNGTLEYIDGVPYIHYLCYIYGTPKNLLKLSDGNYGYLATKPFYFGIKTLSVMRGQNDQNR